MCGVKDGRVNHVAGGLDHRDTGRPDYAEPAHLLIDKGRQDLRGGAPPDMGVAEESGEHRGGEQALTGPDGGQVIGQHLGPRRADHR
eukprot:896070-Alexandrium_andersonii.AAC.1